VKGGAGAAAAAAAAAAGELQESEEFGAAAAAAAAGVVQQSEEFGLAAGEDGRCRGPGSAANGAVILSAYLVEVDL
jgi:hypothetical protein